MVQTVELLHAQLAALRSAHPAQQCVIDGHTWTYIEAGSQEQSADDTILLLPGALGEADTSFQYIMALQTTHRVVSVGYPPTLDRLGALSGGLHVLLGRLHIPGAHVVGGSYSGLAAQHFAAQRPGRVRSLLLSNTGAPAPAQAPLWSAAAYAVSLLPEASLQRIMRANIRRFLPGGSPAEAFWRDYFAANLPRWSKRAVVSRLRLMSRMHGAAEAAHLHRAAFWGPVLIINAAGDRLIPPAQRRGLVALYPQARRVTIADKGHIASLDEAAAYIRLYREFLCRDDHRSDSRGEAL